MGLTLPAFGQPGPASPPIPQQAEFSATLVKQVEGRKSEAQVFAKGDRLRLEYKYALKTELGLSSIEIIRLDKRESWFLLAQRRQILSVPIKPEEILPIQAPLPGEKTRTLLGDATTVGRSANLYEVRTDYNGRNERYYEWVDVETGVVLKLVSQDRDWSIEYSRIRFSSQPDYYFDEPSGYKRWVPESTMKERG
ncbi:MAG: hypothetical protein KF814_18180 [Nitrospiraceae bacterium]|nr:hypothetical protein [Nitrospiraceae bacterium]